MIISDSDDHLFVTNLITLLFPDTSKFIIDFKSYIIHLF